MAEEIVVHDLPEDVVPGVTWNFDGGRLWPNGSNPRLHKPSKYKPHMGAKQLAKAARRAKRGGSVEINPIGPLGDYFADIFVDENSHDGQVRLDAGSYRALKNHWMRCKVETRDP